MGAELKVMPELLPLLVEFPAYQVFVTGEAVHLDMLTYCISTIQPPCFARVNDWVLVDVIVMGKLLVPDSVKVLDVVMLLDENVNAHPGRAARLLKVLLPAMVRAPDPVLLKL